MYMQNFYSLLLRGGNDLTYGDLLKISNGESIDSFYSKDELELKNMIEESDKKRLQKYK